MIGEHGVDDGRGPSIPTGGRPPQPDEERALAGPAFVMKLAEALHCFGTPAPRLEQALTHVSERLGLKGQFFTTPTSLFGAFGALEQQRTFLIRVTPGSVDLERMALLDRLSAAVARGEIDAARGAREIDALRAAPPRYGSALQTFAVGISSAAATRFFGGGAREILAALVIGLAIGLLALFVTARPRWGHLFEPSAAALAATLATLMAALLGATNASLATAGGLIVLLPGFSLTIAISELASQHLSSGTARLSGALTSFLSIGFGLTLGQQIQRIVPSLMRVEPEALPDWTLGPALILSCAALTVLFRAAPRDAWWILAAGSIAFVAARAGASWLGPELGMFVAALALGSFANAYSRWLERPSAIPLVPGLMMLVPGSLGFRGISLFMQDDVLRGIDVFFTVAMTAAALVGGLLLSSLVIARGRAL